MKIKNKNRLGIFVFFDNDGIVDDYVTYLLDDIIVNLKEMVIICNGKIGEVGLKKLKKYTDKIYIRDNVGFDVSAWRDGILNFLKRDYLESFDEVLFFNDTFYGPLYPFSEVFDVMNKKDIDFWGLTSHGESISIVKNKKVIVPKFLQSYFFAFRKSVISSDIFYDYWRKLPPANDIEYIDAVTIFENKFAEYFSKKGFKYDSYIDNSTICNDIDHSICYNTFMPYGMIKNRNLPIVRRKVFKFDFYEVINNNANEEAKKALDYIKENTNYPIKYIWDNLLRLYNVRDLKTTLHLNYVIDDKFSHYHIKETNAAVFAHIYYTDILEDSYEYLKNIPENVDLYISTNSDDKAEYIKSYLKDLKIKKIIVLQNRGRDLASLLVGFREDILKYKYFCFIHDKKTSGGNGPITVGRSFQYTEFENLLRSKEYIKNVLETFEKNESLGFLSPPSPLHNIYFASIGEEWTSCYDITKELLDRFDVNVPVCKEKPPFCLATCFWARTDALEKLLKYNWKYEDFDAEPLPTDGTISHALERSFSYFAQEKKYYSGWVLSREYAAIEIANLDRMLSEIVNILQEQNKNSYAYSYGAFIDRLKALTCPTYYQNTLPHVRKFFYLIGSRGVKYTFKFYLYKILKKEMK